MDMAMSQASMGQECVGRATRIVMIPSASSGIGHISRTAALARALRRLDPAVEVELLLDTERLCPFNIDAARRMGFTPRFLPPRTRDNRGAIVRACLERAWAVLVQSGLRGLFLMSKAQDAPTLHQFARAGRMEGGNHLARCTPQWTKSAEGVLAWTSPI